jgi:glycosyltransferase involved in cell wall biosynthesis
MRAAPSGRASPLRENDADVESPLGVLFVHSATSPPLGADTWVHAQIMRTLDRSNHHVHVACVPGPPGAPTPTYELVREIPDVRIVPIDFGPERFTRARRSRMRILAATAPAGPSLVSLARYVRRQQIAVIHTSDRPRDAAAAIVLGRLTGAKCVIQAHVGFGDWMSPVLKWSLRKADALVAISKFVAGTLVAAGHDPARVHVVLNGIEAAPWQRPADRNEIRRRLGLAPSDPVVLTVCRLFPSKGVGELIDAVAALPPRHPNLRLLVAGHEMVKGYADELAQRAAQRGVTETVVFLGRRDDVDQLMVAADVFAMPSIGEPFGLVYLEAMATGTPVVALDSGGAPEVVDHGLTGLLSPVGDSTALTANLATLLDDPGLRAAMGEEGRRQIQARFTIDRMGAEMAAVYRAACGRPQNAGTERKAREVAFSR